MINKKDVGTKVSIAPVTIKNCVENIEGKFAIEDISREFEDGLRKALTKRKYEVAEGGDAVIEGDINKIDIGNRFHRYISLGFAGKAGVAVSGKIVKNGTVLEEYDIEVPATSASWIHTPRFLCRSAARGCALKVAKLFSK